MADNGILKRFLAQLDGFWGPFGCKRSIWQKTLEPPDLTCAKASQILLSAALEHFAGLIKSKRKPCGVVSLALPADLASVEQLCL